jgi:hypothetical protein
MKFISASVLCERIIGITLHELPNEAKIVMLGELERIDKEVGVSHFNPYALVQ